MELFHGHQTRRDVMSVTIITEKRVNGISWTLQDMSDIT